MRSFDYLFKNPILIVLVLITFCQVAAGQQIYMERTFGGARFETDTLSLSNRDVLDLMQNNPEARGEFSKAKLNYSTAGVLGFTGGVLVALPLVTAVVGGKPEWMLAAAGSALVLLSIPFIHIFYRHAENALEIYDMQYQASRVCSQLYFTGTVGKLVIRF